ncbi:MAG: polysaccharide deacetylase family protein, partial [Solirubrobacteraceae bacterium]
MDLSDLYGSWIHNVPAPTTARCAIVLTLDNLGEAAALERGTWSPRVPIGRDPSVTDALPRLLDELDANGLTATFFVEAINCEHNPRALREIADRGHELGLHGWRHEPWAALALEDERALLERGRSGFERVGLRAAAFRPPGGEPTAHTARMLEELGFDWWSPAAGTARAGDGPICIPFDWELVDAYHLMDRFASLRRARG